MAKILLDLKLPENLDNEATSATSSDWVTIQKSGETFVRKIRPLAAVPNLPAERLTSGFIDTARIPTLDASKIGTGTFNSARIPSLDASKITSGTFNLAQIPALDASRIPSLDASKITSGTFNTARIPLITTAMMDDNAVSAAAQVYSDGAIGGSESQSSLQYYSFVPNYSGRVLVIASANFGCQFTPSSASLASVTNRMVLDFNGLNVANRIAMSQSSSSSLTVGSSRFATIAHVSTVTQNQTCTIELLGYRTTTGTFAGISNTYSQRYIGVVYLRR